MAKHESKDRRTWIRHHLENGKNISATCREFGISRATFYRWLARYDPDRPSKPLKSRSRRPHTKRQPQWTELDLRLLAELDFRCRRFGAGRLTALMNDLGIRYSRATVGRMLRRIRLRCPTCSMPGGIHHGGVHALENDLGRFKDRMREEREYWDRTVRGYEAGHRQPGPP